MKRPTSALALVLAGASTAGAEKLPSEFKAAFERKFWVGRTYAVVMQPGVPTTSIYGVKGDSTNAHYSVDVIDGNWRTSEGLLDFDQTVADFLDLGEVVELASMSYKDNRVDLRMTPLEVLDTLGRPQKELTFQNTTRWTYPDLTVIFENGKVKEVKF